MKVGKRKRKGTPPPTHHPPGTPGKILELSLRVLTGSELWNKGDAKVGSEYDGPLSPVYYPGEEEMLERLGYEVVTRGKEFFVKSIVLQGAPSDENVVLHEKELPEGRHRSEKEKEWAQAHLAEEAERKRQERVAQRQMKKKTKKMYRGV